MMLSGCRALDLTDKRCHFAGRILTDLGVDVVKIDSPRAGVYSFLVGANSRKTTIPSFEQLATGGFVYSHWESDPEPSDTRVFVEGGKKPTSVYVYELESLEVSTQSEADEFFGDDNDSGMGEFRVNVCTMLASRVVHQSPTGSTPNAVKLGGSVTYPEYPNWLLPDPLYIYPHPNQQIICYPKMPIATFSEEIADKADNFVALVNVVEDDDVSWFQSNKPWYSLVKGIAPM